MNHDTPLDDHGHAIALAAIALLALSLGAGSLVDAAIVPTRAELQAVYSDEIAAGVLLYRLPPIAGVTGRENEHVAPAPLAPHAPFIASRA